MTIIRQWAVTNSTLGNMRRLMNEDERILIRGEQFLPSIIGSPVSWRKWDSLMEATRKGFGHDKPSRRVRDKETGLMRALCRERRGLYLSDGGTTTSVCSKQRRSKCSMQVWQSI